ncbi:MAG: dienelactone hydrolase family protein [Caldilineaceae bacterium]|nr:dienelactone hydrolase family protein [Caldilineaceae bacterium]
MSELETKHVLAPHGGMPVYTLGATLSEAEAAMILVHGRGSSAADILGLARMLVQERFVYVAPQAARNTWYPNRFIAPIESNEPDLSSALALVDSLVLQLSEQSIPQEKVVLLGFSQGACLVQEYAVRNAGRFGGIVGLSGGLIGPPGTQWHFGGSMDGTPVFLGCSDVDFHIPLERVDESAAVFERMGAAVTKRIYPGMGHTVNEDEIEFVRDLIEKTVD